MVPPHRRWKAQLRALLRVLVLRAGAPAHEGKSGAPGLTKCRLEREAHFLGGVFFGLKVLPKNGMARCQPGVQGAPADLVLLPEQGERGWAEGQKQRRDKAARSAVTGSLTEARFSAVPRMSPGVQLKPDPFPSGRAPPPVTARSARGGRGLAARCPVTGPAPPARTRRPSRLFRHVTKPGDTGGANGARHPRNRPHPEPPAQAHSATLSATRPGTGPYHPTGAPSSERRSGARCSRHTDGPSSCSPPPHLTGETRRRRPSRCETPATPSPPQSGVQGQPRGAGPARPGCSIGVRLNCGGQKAEYLSGEAALRVPPPPVGSAACPGSGLRPSRCHGDGGAAPLLPAAAAGRAARGRQLPGARWPRGMLREPREAVPEGLADGCLRRPLALSAPRPAPAPQPH